VSTDTNISHKPSATVFATFGCPSTVGGRARYDETGELHFGTYAGQAHRSLEYMRLENATVMLYFIDRRPFIDLDLSTGAWHSSHVCGDDCYEIAIFVRSHKSCRSIGGYEARRRTTTRSRLLCAWVERIPGSPGLAAGLNAVGAVCLLGSQPPREPALPRAADRQTATPYRQYREAATLPDGESTDPDPSD
jgi:hypothetical protein